MDWLSSALSIENVAFDFAGYRLSYLELVGTLLNLTSVWLVTRNNAWTWPVGNVAVVLFAFLFFQIQLYSDLVEQVYFLVAGFYGWWAWLYGGPRLGARERPIVRTTSRGRVAWSLAIGVGTLAMGFVMERIHLELPRLFPEPASFPYLDAFTTVMSFAATLLMAHKMIECWYLWIAVDVIGIGLYFAKDVVFVAGLYVAFLVLAIRGLRNWTALLAASRGRA